MWKTILGWRIYSSSQLEIYENFLYRWLRFNSSALQTLINKRKPWKPALNYLGPLISAVKLQPAACCMLGLGGGGAVLALAPFLEQEKLLVTNTYKASLSWKTMLYQLFRNQSAISI